MNRDWYDIKFLESATNVRGILGRSSGRRPSASVAREISVCLQQGRLFFEAAEAAPIQIKPLQLYYGVVAFAQAVVLAKRNASIATLTRAHGLRDVTSSASGTESLRLSFDTKGTFQEFNDTIAPLGRIWYFDNFMPKWFEKPFDLSSRLDGQAVTIDQILGRLPSLSQHFSQTFGVVAETVPISLGFEAPLGGLCTLRLDDPELFSDRTSLVACVKKWREAYPFLNHWRFKEASLAWGFAILIFDNLKHRGDDISEEMLVEANGGAFVSIDTLRGKSQEFISVADILPPLSGGFSNAGTSVIQPLAGVMLSEHSLQFLGSFLFSSLVRYRPQIWQNALSRSATTASGPDDRALSLIEQFLDDVLESFPAMVVRAIDYPRTS